MGFALRFLQIAVAVEFLALGLFSVASFLRYRDLGRRELAIALAFAGTLPAIAVLQREFGTPRGPIGDLKIALFLASGWTLLRFRHRMIPLRRGTLLAAGIAAATATIAAVVTHLPGEPLPGQGIPRSPLGVIVLLLFAAFIAEPIRCFWKASHGRAAMQRSRLRALAAGYATGLIVSITAIPAAGHPISELVRQSFALVVAPLMWMAFQPPHFVRRAWRVRDPHARNAMDQILAYAPDERALAEMAIEPVLAIAGADAGAIVNTAGAALIARGMTAKNASELIVRAGTKPAVLTRNGDAAIVVPLSFEEPFGHIVVVAGPFTPLFGSHELDELTKFAAAVSIAMDRVRAVAALRQHTTRYAGLVNALGDLGEGFVITDGMKATYVNDAYCRLTGYTREELLALPTLLQLAPPDEKERVLERRTRRLAGAPSVDHYDSALIHKHGQRVELEVSMKILEGPKDPQIVSVIRDVTDRRRSEERLRATLQREHEAVERLQALDEMKNAFLSAVSHELRTPLTSVLGFARTLHSLGNSLDENERHEVATRLLTGAEKLERLLADLLDLDRLSRGVIEPRRRPVDLGGLVRSIVHEFLATGERTVQLDIDPVVVDVDQPQIERVVENLIINAARHTDAGTPIWARVHEAPGGAVIIVEDAGSGVPAELHDEIFEPFKQGPIVRRHSPGVGIGLSLVRRFVELHGGTVSVGDREGGGASFRVFLPATEQRRPQRMSRTSRDSRDRTTRNQTAAAS